MGAGLALDCTVLITGYTVFSGYQLNPSEEIASMLEGARVAGCRVQTLIMPVSLRRVIEILPRKLREVNPSMVLGLGLSPRARKVTLELAAASIAHYPEAPDEDGFRANLHPLTGRSALDVKPTQLPVARIVEECAEKRQLPLTVNLSIGTYLCNVAAYIIHSYAEQAGVPGGFLHLPPTTELAMRHRLSHSIPLSLQAETVKCVVETAVSHARKASDSTEPAG